jgi:DNA replicative helicase MCM subunit Mcm2 (Cdc46/Mcm family)
MFKRFELLFCVNDDFDELKEKSIINAIANRFINKNTQIETQKYNSDYITKYLYYVRIKFNPILSDKAYKLFSEKVITLKSNGLNLSTRVYSTILKIASWYAKFRQSNTIDEIDIKKALNLHAISLKSQEYNLF